MAENDNVEIVQNDDDRASLAVLRILLMEPDSQNDCGCGCFSDAELLAMLGRHGGDVRAAAYEGLLRKAEDDAARLPDGLTLPGNRDFWLGLARYYRPCVSRTLTRADEEWKNDGD